MLINNGIKLCSKIFQQLLLNKTYLWSTATIKRQTNLRTHSYGIRLSHIFEIASILDEKPSISLEIPSILIENLGIQWKYYNRLHNIFEVY